MKEKKKEIKKAKQDSFKRDGRKMKQNINIKELDEWKKRSERR